MLVKNRRVRVFLNFLVFGLVLGLVEDIIAVLLSTGEKFSWHMLLIITLVTIPFAAFGEFVVDKTDLLKPRQKRRTLFRELELFLEFFVFGFAMGLVEDLIAVRFATSHPITLTVVGICALVTLPFAAFGELLIDRFYPHKKSKSNA